MGEPNESLEEIVGGHIHLHLEKLIYEINCPSFPNKVVLYLARQKFDPTKGDVKYYYNCNKGLACTDDKCIFKRSVEFLKEKTQVVFQDEKETYATSRSINEAFYSVE